METFQTGAAKAPAWGGGSEYSAPKSLYDLIVSLGEDGKWNVGEFWQFAWHLERLRLRMLDAMESIRQVSGAVRDGFANIKGKVDGLSP